MGVNRNNYEPLVAKDHSHGATCGQLDYASTLMVLFELAVTRTSPSAKLRSDSEFSHTGVNQVRTSRHKNNKL